MAVLVISKRTGEKRVIKGSGSGEVWAGPKFSKITVGRGLAPIITTMMPEDTEVASHMHGYRPRFAVMGTK